MSRQILIYAAGGGPPSPQADRFVLAQAEPGQQALLALAHLRKGETFAGLAVGFGVSTATAGGMRTRPCACWPPALRGCAPRCGILWASGPLPGSAHDLTAARTLGVIRELAAAGLIVLADKGYNGAGEPLITPYRGRNKPACQ
jgi:hypothetical protein